jgi:hypothetical protein
MAKLRMKEELAMAIDIHTNVKKSLAGMRSL